MTPATLTLARHLVTLPRWEWRDGMLDTWGDRGPGPARGDWLGLSDVPLADRPDCLPDLTDPCTLGALLGLVREAWGPDTAVQPFWVRDIGADKPERANDWRVGNGQRGICNGPTEAAALVAALEGAK